MGTVTADTRIEAATRAADDEIQAMIVEDTTFTLMWLTDAHKHRIMRAALAAADATAWQPMSTCPRDWSHPVYLAWWERGSGRLAGRRVSFTGVAHWMTTDDGGEWHPVAHHHNAVPEAQAYAWMPIPLGPPLPEETFGE